MKSLQTPQKEHARFSELAIRRSKETQSKSINEQDKKPHKITKKSLNSAFSSVSEDMSLELTKEPIDFSPISEVSDGNHQLGKSAESFMLALNTPLSASSEKFASFDQTPSSKITSDMDEGGEISAVRYGSGESDGLKIGSVEAELVVKHLRQARSRVLKSSDVELGYKKLLDAVIKIVIEELYSLPEERDRFAELVTAKACIVFLSFVLWFLFVSVAFFYSSVVGRSFNDPPPT